MKTENSMPAADPATPDARETLLGLIECALERLHAMPANMPCDYAHEATALVAQVEAWTLAFQRAGSLVFRDPADDVDFIEGGR